MIFYFRTERDGADAVYLIEYDKQDRMKERDMEYSHSDSLFDYYRCKYILGEEVLNYCFRADREEDICFYGRLGAAD